MRLNFRHKIISLSLFVGLFFWLLDTLLDLYHKHYAKTFIESLFIDEPIHDFYTRILVFVLFITFGIIMSIYVDKIEWMDTRYSKLFTGINDAIFIVECGGIQTNKYKISEVNRYASVMLGYQKEELLQLSFSDLITSKIPPGIPCLTETLTEEKHNVFEAEMERKGGGNLIVEISVYPGDVSGKPVALLIARDITRRKISEEALLESERQLGILASQLINAQETERQRISVGLHDELGQALMHLKFRVGSFINKSQDSSPPSTDAGNGLLSGVDEIIEYVRRLSRELSPSVLEEIGLTSSIHYLAEEFCGNYRMDCNSIEVDEIDHIFSFETQLNIFRIFQECLTNAARHARATRVSVAVKERGDHVFFKVEDDGKGFDVKEGVTPSGAQRGIGISAMQQRVRMAGGTFEISSAEGMGTSVTFTIPVTKGA